MQIEITTHIEHYELVDAIECLPVKEYKEVMKSLLLNMNMGVMQSLLEEIVKEKINV